MGYFGSPPRPLDYQGTWDADTNTPALASGVGTQGHFYIISVAGITNLDGETDWQVGDWAVFGVSTWTKVDNTQAAHELGGALHLADTLADVNGKVSDAALVFSTEVGTGKAHTTLESAIDAFEASGTVFGHFLITSDLTFSTNKTLTKPVSITGTSLAGSRRKLTLDGRLRFDASSPSSIQALHLFNNQVAGGLNSGGPYGGVDMNDCLLEVASGAPIVTVGISTRNYIRCFNCEFEAAANTDGFFKWSLGSGNETILLFEACRETAGSASGAGLVKQTPIAGTFRLNLADGTNFPTLEVALNGLLTWSRDGSSRFGESQFTGSPTLTRLLDGTRVQDTGGPTELGVGAIPDGSIAQRIGSAFVGGRLFAATVGTSQDYADVRSALEAFKASAAPYSAYLAIMGDVNIGSADASNYRSFHMEGVEKDSGEKPKVTFNNSLSINPPIADGLAHYRFTNLHLLGSTAAKRLRLPGSTRACVEFNRCRFDQPTGLDFLIDVIANQATTLIFRDCEFWTETASQKIVRFGGSNPTGQMIFINCREVSGTAAGDLIYSLGTNTALDVAFLSGSRFATLKLQAGDTDEVINVRRDGSSDFPEANMYGTGTINIVRVGGDQLRETGGPTLLNMGAVPDLTVPQRVGGDILGKTLAELGAKQFTGFADSDPASTSDIEMNGGTPNQFDILPTGSDYDFWVAGTKYTKSGTDSVTVAADQTLSYIWFDNTGTLQIGTSIWEILDDIALVATVYKDGSNYEVTDERHYYDRDRAYHRWAHVTIGARYGSGLTGTFTNTTLSVTQGVTYDEDLKRDTGGTETDCNLWYRNGGLTAMRVEEAVSTPYKVSAGVIQYDNAGTLTNVPNNFYVNSYVYATGDVNQPIGVLVGQGAHVPLETARNESFPSILLSTAEWKLLYRVTYRNAGGTPTFIEQEDFRFISAGPAVEGGSVAHAGLTGRDAANQHPASALAPDVSSFAGKLSAADDTVQKALDTLDDAVPLTHGASHTDGTDDAPDLVGDSGAGGTHGLAPAPGAGDTAANKFLKADGAWSTPAGVVPAAHAIGGAEHTTSLPAAINALVTGDAFEQTSKKSAASGYASLDGSGKVPTGELPASVLGDVAYQGVWNATTNTPALASGVGTKGYYYKVSVAGSTNLDGITDWKIGDMAIFNGATWDKIDNAESVVSVHGRTGAVAAVQDDYAHSQASAIGTDDHHAKSHAAEHTDGTQDIQDATSGQKGLATATQITKLDGIEALAEVNDVDSVHGRTGAVVAVQDDYSHSQASGIGATDHHSNANDPSAGEKAALPGTSGTPGGANKYVTNDDARNSDGRIPKDWGTQESLARSTTTSGTFQDKATLATGALTGTYRFFATAALDNNGDLGEARLWNDTDSAQIGALTIFKANDTDERHSIVMVGEVTLAGVSKDIVLQWRDQAGGNTQGITSARIEMQRVS